MTLASDALAARASRAKCAPDSRHRFVPHIIRLRPPMRRLLVLLLCATLSAAAASPAAVEQLVRDALGNPPAGSLVDYANAVARDPARYESLTNAARRILAGTPPTQQPPDRTALELHQLAESLLASTAPENQIAGHQARFHARRIIAAVHYNLFKRGLRLAELVAATYAEKDAVAAWRDVVLVATFGQHPSAATFRADLKKFETSLKELEEQCCPPDEAVMKEPVWQPAAKL